eukprot:CAMPEP_0185018116 /NCGR_PEP_ID=MMETSP1103-20130426/951_1 /TAXON_ID=36769 /ORGANISM="Paraphysomonas bandaiensis, Strain Caron Lab Isolate" /LENGTH=67 /DNA_ID=CAMNT_0027547829 /DNA_START=60 /DNA_END=263 /DNA_ORIENTATION=+
MSTTEKENVLDILEEDDEFEEFENSNWEDATGADDGQLWQDDWDDVDTNDDFTEQLRQQFESTSNSN